MELIVAFSTHDGVNLVTDDHAGMARYFVVYRVSDDEAEFLERRENSKYKGNEALKHGDPNKAQQSLSALEGVDAWANPRFGPNLPRLLKEVLCVVVRVNTIEEGLALIRNNLSAVAAECARGEERKHLLLKPA
ncbi:MAG: hypothetical protein KKI08_10150 [Armatimonadetes bacterium]|nr:hypothetical protein [Armatimonadota bacterium]